MSYSNINKSTDNFNTVLYTGNGYAGHAITGVGFEPSLTWIKRRSADGWHYWTDAVRGATKTIFSNRTDAESTENGGLTAFGTDGFTVGNSADVNGNGQTHVAWNWKAGGAGSSNSDGSITSTVSANTTAGFSIVAFNGNSGTVGHGLGVKPNFIVVKSRQTGGSNNWVVAHSALGTNMNDNYITLNLNSAAGSSSNTWGGEPTSQHFTVSNGVAANDNNIAYCFAEKTGYSKFGSYKGNGNADGTFIYLGFKPAVFLAKETTTSNWFIKDNKRLTSFNPSNGHLYPNLNNVEEDYADFDFLSNGIKIRHNGTDVNESGVTYIYMAFAEAPLVGSNNLPCTAR